MTSLSVAIVSYECREALLACLTSIQASLPPEVEVVVADSASTDGGSQEAARRFPRVRLLCLATNLGFGAAANRAIRATSGEAVLLLNADVCVPAGGPERLLQLLQGQPRAAIAAPPLVGVDGGIRLSWGRDPGILAEAQRKLLEASVRRGSRLALALAGGPVVRPRRVPWASAAALLVRRMAFEAAGGFDEGFFLYFEDIDLCLRLRAAGWETWLVNAPSFVHEEGASARRVPRLATEAYRRSQIRFFRRHRGRLTIAAVRGLVGTRLLFSAAFQAGTPAERRDRRDLGLRILRGDS